MTSFPKKLRKQAKTLRNLLKPDYQKITGQGVKPSASTIKNLQKQLVQNEKEELKQQLKLNNIVKAALIPAKNYAINKLGSDKDASLLVNMVPGVNVTGLRKLQEKWRKEQGIK